MRFKSIATHASQVRTLFGTGRGSVHWLNKLRVVALFLTMYPTKQIKPFGKENKQIQIWMGSVLTLNN
jgi:hypothetical protein